MRHYKWILLVPVAFNIVHPTHIGTLITACVALTFTAIRYNLFSKGWDILCALFEVPE